jgi:hypothetical protein
MFALNAPVRILLLFAYNREVPNVRSYIVSFVDSEGIEHFIRVPAESLYEAAIEAMAAFRRGAFAEMTFELATQLRIRVRAPEEEHTVTVGKVMSWLEGGARSPNEQVKKNRLKERLRR